MASPRQTTRAPADGGVGSPRSRQNAGPSSRQPRRKPLRYTLADFGLYCRQFRTDTGHPLRLERFEREMLREYFDGIRETVIIIPKKNGKTTLLAVLALYHLERTPDAECIIVAASQEQARKLFNQAAAMVRRSGVGERFRVMTGYGHIYPAGGDSAGPRIEVRPASPENVDGVTPTLALVDELHRHRDDVVYGILRDGLVARDGRMVTISTAGSAADSPLGRMRDGLHEHPTFRRDHKAKRNYALTEAMVLHEWCLDSTEDTWNMALVKKANPAPWQTVKALRERRYSESMTDGQWMRYACGIWTEGEEPWIEPRAWDQLATAGLEVTTDDEDVWVGVHGGQQNGFALTLVARRDGDYVADVMIIPPPVRFADVEELVRDVNRLYRPRRVLYTSSNFDRSGEVLHEEGVPVAQFPISAPRFADASATLLRVIQDGRLRHSGDPGFRAQVMAGRITRAETGWRLRDDPRSRRPVAALFALAAAVRQAESEQDTEPIFAFA